MGVDAGKDTLDLWYTQHVQYILHTQQWCVERLIMAAHLREMPYLEVVVGVADQLNSFTATASHSHSQHLLTKINSVALHGEREREHYIMVYCV